MTARAGRDGGTVSTDDGVGDVTEFAALLSELKGRTERSYGSLARRLGMNTSTLHRYCAGEAVPQDFGRVERLAEFCGATPQERLELHRRWLRAVAARQRTRGAAAAEPVEAGNAAEAAAAAGPRPARTTATGEKSGLETATPVDARDVADTVEAGEGTEAAEAAHAGHGAQAAEAVAPAPADATARRSPVSAQAPRPWYRRRSSTVLVGVACALLATLGTLSALPGDRHPSVPDGAAPSAGSPTVSSGTSVAGRSPSPVPSAGASSPTPAASPSGGLGPLRTSPSAGSGPRVGRPPATASGVPLTWTADSQVWAQGCGHDYVIDKPPAQVPPPPAEQDAGPWAGAQGAVHGRETNVEISVQGRSSTAVVLTALRVRVVGRAAPTPGTVYAMDQGCGGSLTRRYFAVDLDRDRPVAHSVAGNDAGTPIPAVSLPYRVSSEDPEVLLVTARTEACDCEWFLELDWSSQGRTGTVRVDDHGRPFRTSSIKGLPRYWYGSDGGERRWVPASD